MSNTLFTPVERIDGISEQRNKAEKHMHLFRYQHAARILRDRWGGTGENRSILDIACGLGYGSRELRDRTGAAVTGMDISSEAVSSARKTYGSGITFRTGSITGIPAPDSTYDAVVCYETIEHVTYKEGRTALNELWRVLKPGGTLLISTPNRIYTYCLQLMGMKNPYHFYEYMPRELRNLLSAKGFRHEYTYGQTLCFPITYYLGRREWISSRYFYPSRHLPAELSMIAIIQMVKGQK